MTEGSASEAVKQAKADYGWALMVLGALLSASSVISLIQHGFHFHLQWGFEHFVAFYRGFITPVMDVVLWPVRALLGWLHFEWIIPPWLKDVWVLSFIGVGLWARSVWGAIRSIGRKERRQEGVEEISRSLWAFFPLWWVPVLMFLSGLLGGGLFVLFFAFGKDRPARKRWDTRVRWYGHLRSNLVMTALAVIVFYISNAIAPQLGLG